MLQTPGFRGTPFGKHWGRVTPEPVWTSWCRSPAHTLWL
jgi:hypothetical protein